jgi:hypothetical protein
MKSHYKKTDLFPRPFFKKRNSFTYGRIITVTKTKVLLLLFNLIYLLILSISILQFHFSSFIFAYLTNWQFHTQIHLTDSSSCSSHSSHSFCSCSLSQFHTRIAAQSFACLKLLKSSKSFLNSSELLSTVLNRSQLHSIKSI